MAGLHRLANSRLFAPRTAAAPIQVLGRAESAGLCFDHLWLAGLAQASWPPVARIRLPRQVAHAPLYTIGALSAYWFVARPAAIAA